MSSNLQAEIIDFWSLMLSDNLTDGSGYVVNAYTDSMSEGSTPQPWAALFNIDNGHDQLKTVTQDIPVSGNYYFAYSSATTSPYVNSRGANESVPPIYEEIDNNNGLIRTDLPSASGLLLRKIKSLRPPMDFTKSKHLSFAKSVSKSVDGRQIFRGKQLTETLSYSTSLSKQEAADLATNYIAQQFPEFASRLELGDVSERVSGVLHKDGTASSSTNGYLVQFLVSSDGIPVWGNYINVIIAGDAIEGVQFLCNTEPQSTGPNNDLIQPLTSRGCLTTALPDIKSALGINSKYEVFAAKLYYVNRSVVRGSLQESSGDFIPAWHLIINKSYKDDRSPRELYGVWIDALSGKMIEAKSY